MEKVKSEGFLDWVHRRLDEGESDSDLKPSKPPDPLTPSEPSDSTISSPGV
jgi:hypothetical protein